MYRAMRNGRIFLKRLTTVELKKYKKDVTSQLVV
jgi:hypothetical protein